MSWFSDAFDWVSDSGNWGWAKDAGDWIDRNSGYIKTAKDIYNAVDSYNNRTDTRNNLLDVYKNIMAQDQQYNNTYNNWQAQNWQAQQAQDAARRAAAMSAMKGQTAALKKISAQYDPYVKIAKRLMPKMEKDYNKFLKSTGLLNAYLTPLVTQAQPPVQSWQIQASLPESAYSAAFMPKNEVVVPALEELVKKGKQ